MAAIRIKLPRPLPWQERLGGLVRRAIKTGKPKFILAAMGRRAGKSVGCSDIAGSTALSIPGCKVLWGAHSWDGVRIARDIFKGPQWFEDTAGKRTEYTMFGPVAEIRSQPPEADLLNGSKVFWRSMGGDGTVIGRGYHLAVIDEAVRVSRNVVRQDLIPATADTGGPVVAITSPGGDLNWTYDWYRKALDGNPLYAAINGPSTENPSPQIRAFVEMMREDMGEDDPIFRQEILAEFIKGAGSVFTNIEENARLEGWRESPVEGGIYVIGADLGEQRDYTVLLAMEAKTGEVHGYFRGRRMSWPAQVATIMRFTETWGGRLWIDETGVGSPIVDDLRSRGVTCVGISLQSQQKHDILVALRVAMSQDAISYPPEPVLTGEMAGYHAQALPSGRLKYSAPQGKHDDCVIALALANWARVQGMSWQTVNAGLVGWVA